MPRLDVRRFTANDLEPAAVLLADRHRRDRLRLPVLDPGLESASRWTDVMAKLLANPDADLAVAERDGRVVGVAGGTRLLVAPDSVDAMFLPTRSIAVGSDEHAVAAEEDATGIYRALYAHLSERWVADGFFAHRWRVTAGDRDVEEALVSLGFGRIMTAATRIVAAPVEGEGASLEIRAATVADLEVVAHLSELLAAFHAEPPMFWPYIRSTEAAVRAMLREMLGEDQPPVFLGLSGGRAVALQSFLRPGFTPPLIDREGDVYLFEGMVDPDTQARGAGTALLRYAMAWAQEQGHRTCTLHFASQNFSGGPFWLKHGFEPIEHTLERRVDERVAWARARRKGS